MKDPVPVSRVLLCLAALAGAAFPCAGQGVELLRPDPAGAESGWSPSGDGGSIRVDEDAVWLETNAPGQAPEVRREAGLPVPPPVAVVLAGEVRTEGVERGERSWYSARMLVTYLDGTGRKLGETYTLDRMEGTSDWRPMSRQFPVPEAARRVRIGLQLLKPNAGRVGYRNVSLRALDGNEAQAWRATAEARIREHRMAPLRVRVIDETGGPVAGADVAVFMRRHAYPFGTAAQARLLAMPPGDPQAETYRAVVADFFNYVTLESDLKSKTVEAHGLEKAVAALEWLRARGIAVRGHVLTWPSYKMSSKAEVAAKGDPVALREAMRRSFARRLDATARFGLADWDVLNEPMVHNDLLRVLGDGQAAEWFRWAREGAPEARLYLNENNVEFAGANREGLERWIRRLRDDGAPLGGLGWQGHMWHRTLPSGQNILADLDHFARYGLPVQITEYDVDDRFPDEEEARFLDEFLTAWFSHPLTAGFIMWGFKDDLMWNGNAPLFRSDWSLKPAGKVWMEHVFGKWWTEERGGTGADGMFATRAFLGDYEVEASAGGRRAKASVKLTGEGAEAMVRLEGSTTVPEPLASSNPYRLGRLPKVTKSEGKAAEMSTVVVVPTTSAAAPWRASGRDAQPRNDVYARFDAGDTARRAERAVVRVRLARAPAAGAVLRVYALSNRFVPDKGEPGGDWTGADLAGGRAPGRDPQTGEYRAGDAAVLLLGEIVCDPSAGEGWLRFSVPRLAKAVAQSVSPGITLILSPATGGAEVETVELELGVPKP